MTQAEQSIVQALLWWAEKYAPAHPSMDAARKLLGVKPTAPKSPVAVRERRLRSFAVRRPYCSPEGTVIVAYSAEEAVNLAHKAYGYASDTTAQDSEVGRG